MLLRRYRDAFNHLSKRRNDRGLRLEVGSLVPESQAENYVNHLPSGPFPDLKECVGQRIAGARAFVNERSPTVVQIIQSGKIKLNDFVSGHSAPDDSPLDGRCDILYHAVLLVSCINTAPDGCSFALQSCDG